MRGVVGVLLLAATEVAVGGQVWPTPDGGVIAFGAVGRDDGLMTAWLAKLDPEEANVRQPAVWGIR